MATLKKKVNPDEVTVEVTDTKDEEPSYINEEEKEVIDADGEQYLDDSSKVSSKKMSSVLELLQEQFNLKGKGFELIGYSDKGNKIVATLANGDFEIQFTIKSSNILMNLELNK